MTVKYSVNNNVTNTTSTTKFTIAKLMLEAEGNPDEIAILKKMLDDLFTKNKGN